MSVHFRMFKNWSKKDWIIGGCKNIALISGIGYLFYGTFLAALPGCIFWYPLMKLDYRIWENKRKERLRMEFREAIQNIRTSLRAGYSMENAISGAIPGLCSIYGKDAEIVREFSYMSNELRMQIPVEKVWRNMADRCRVEEIQNFAAVVQTAKRSGGNLIQVIDHTTELISDELEVQQEIDTMLAGRKMEWKIMTLIPCCIILYMKLSFSEFMSGMYGNLFGMMIMSIALGICIGAYFLGERITGIEM